MLDKKSNVWGVLFMKISYEKRIEATLAYVNQNRTYKEVAKEYDMHPSDLQKWVALYKNHGVAGLSKRTGKYTGDFKLAVIEYMHNTKSSVRETAAYFGIPSFRSVLMWERLYYEEGPTGLFKENRGRSRKMNPKIHPTPLDKKTENQLLTEIQQLRMENEYLKKYNSLTLERMKKK